MYACDPLAGKTGRPNGVSGVSPGTLRQKGLGDCENSDRQGPLPPGLLSHSHSIKLLPEEVWCPCAGSLTLWGWDTGT